MNVPIIVSVSVIGASGVLNALLHQQPLTHVLMGTFIFYAVLSLADLFGGYMSQFASAIALLAMVYILLTTFPWSAVVSLAQNGHL